MTLKTESRWDKCRQWLTDVALFLIGLMCLILGAVSLWRGDPTSATAGLAAGLVLLMASSMERFEVLKGLGVEARIRKLDGAINQATATLEQLRELAEMSGESLVLLNSKIGRYDSAPPAQKSYEIVQRVRRNLISVGSSEDIVRRTLAPWVFVTTFDLVQSLLTEILHPWQLLLQKWDQKIKAYPQPIMAGDSEFQALIDQRKHLGSFQSHHVGAGVHEWQPGTHSQRLQIIVENLPLEEERDRQKLKELIAPWLPRLDYLTANYDLSDKEEWFKKLQH